MGHQISDWWKKTWRIMDGSMSKTRCKISSSASRSCSKKKRSQQCTSCSSSSRWHTCNPTVDGWNATSCLWWSHQDSQTAASWSFPALSKSDCFDFISTADLSQDQRQSLASIMTHRNPSSSTFLVRVKQCTTWKIRPHLLLSTLCLLDWCQVHRWMCHKETGGIRWRR